MLNTHKCAAFAALGLLAALPAAAQTSAQGGSPRVTVDDAAVSFTGQQPVGDRGHVFVPLRGVFEKMGAQVGYDAASRKVTAKSDKSTVEMNVGSDTATVNGQPTQLSAPVKITNGAVLVPVRFLSESLGSSVKFDKDSQTVRVDTSKLPAASLKAPDVSGVQTAQAPPSGSPMSGSPMSGSPAPSTPMPASGTPTPGQPESTMNGQPNSSQPGSPMSGQPSSQTGGTMAPTPVQTAPTPVQTAPTPVQTPPAPVTQAPDQSAPDQSAPAPVAPVQTVPTTQTVPVVVDTAPSYAWVPWVILALVLLAALAWYLNRRGKTGQVIAASDDKPSL